MMPFLPNALQRLAALVSKRGGRAFEARSSTFVQCYFPGASAKDLRFIFERAREAGIIAGFGHLSDGHNLTYRIATTEDPSLLGFHDGLGADPDGGFLYVAAHPDRTGSASVLKFGYTDNLKQRLPALFPDARRPIAEEDVHVLFSPNAAQAEQILRRVFAGCRRGRNHGRRVKEYIDLPAFDHMRGRSGGRARQTRGFDLLKVLSTQAVEALGRIETANRYDPAERVSIANRLVGNASAGMGAVATKTPNGIYSLSAT